MNTESKPRISWSEVAHDLGELASLQIQLFQLNSALFANFAQRAMTLGAAAVVLTLGAIPIALAALALAINGYLGWSLAASLLLSASIAVIVAAVCGSFAYHYWTTAYGHFSESRMELQENLAWLRNTVSESMANGRLSK